MAAILLLNLLIFPSISQNSGALSVRWEPETPVNGSPILFRVKSNRSLRSVSGNWENRRVFFHFDVASGTWYGFAGVGIDSASGPHQLALEATLTSGARISSSHSVPVGNAPYRTVALSVPGQYTEPDAETLERIRQEQALKKSVFSRSGRDRFWSGRFSPPLQSVVTGEFGTKRTFNGVVQSVHQGTDFRADEGTPLGAMNDGEILLARELFFEGGFIVIDHGQGLLTLYLHLSEIQVKEGDFVKKGQVIGLSGSTGRATAPHLHISVRWQGIYLDPSAVLKLKLD